MPCHASASTSPASTALRTASCPAAPEMRRSPCRAAPAPRRRARRGPGARRSGCRASRRSACRSAGPRRWRRRSRARSRPSVLALLRNDPVAERLQRRVLLLAKRAPRRRRQPVAQDLARLVVVGGRVPLRQDIPAGIGRTKLLGHARASSQVQKVERGKPAQSESGEADRRRRRRPCSAVCRQFRQPPMLRATPRTWNAVPTTPSALTKCSSVRVSAAPAPVRPHGLRREARRGERRQRHRQVHERVVERAAEMQQRRLRRVSPASAMADTRGEFPAVDQRRPVLGPPRRIAHRMGYRPDQARGRQRRRARPGVRRRRCCSSTGRPGAAVMLRR